LLSLAAFLSLVFLLGRETGRHFVAQPRAAVSFLPGEIVHPG
jgi:hypothetical protein